MVCSAHIPCFIINSLHPLQFSSSISQFHREAQQTLELFLFHVCANANIFLWMWNDHISLLSGCFQTGSREEEAGSPGLVFPMWPMNHFLLYWLLPDLCGKQRVAVRIPANGEFKSLLRCFRRVVREMYVFLYVNPTDGIIMTSKTASQSWWHLWYMYIHIHTNVCMCIYIYICLNICIYICTNGQNWNI